MFKRLKWWLDRRRFNRVHRRTAKADQPGRAEVVAAALDLLVEMLAVFEGFRSNAYPCQGKVWTYGYGCTRRADGTPVQPGDNIREAAARKLLTEEARAALNHACDLTDGHSPTAGALAAIASLIYNFGPGEVRGSKFIAAWRRLDMPEAEYQFLDFNKAGGKVSRGLTRRRKAEWKVLTGEDWKNVTF